MEQFLKKPLQLPLRNARKRRHFGQAKLRLPGLIGFKKVRRNYRHIHHFIINGVEGIHARLRSNFTAAFKCFL